jgi:hypothetical protein
VIRSSATLILSAAVGAPLNSAICEAATGSRLCADTPVSRTGAAGGCARSSSIAARYSACPSSVAAGNVVRRVTI